MTVDDVLLVMTDPIIHLSVKRPFIKFFHNVYFKSSVSLWDSGIVELFRNRYCADGECKQCVVRRVGLACALCVFGALCVLCILWDVCVVCGVLCYTEQPMHTHECEHACSYAHTKHTLT